MFKKVNCYIFLVLIVVCFSIGLITKHSHKNIKDDIDDFYIGLIDETLVENQINFMKNSEYSLDKSKYILLVTCQSKIEFYFSCGSQKVSVESVIKGDTSLSKGDVIDILTLNATFIPDYVQFGSLNFGFLNQLKPNNQYIIFLDECVSLDNKDTIFLYNIDYLMKPYFSVDEINASPIESELSDGYFAKYGNINNNDVFMMSSDSINKWNEFRKEVIDTYIQ
ncbi:MAG: hypothetical protein NC489_45805 [Ruminococcus flavefaciens]|nr:hypothetical protein [Ruminococcus flavefaciens]